LLFSVVVVQSHRHWTIYKTFISKISAAWEARQVSLTMLSLLSYSSTLQLVACINLESYTLPFHIIPCYLRLWVCVWVVTLSLVVTSHWLSLPSYEMLTWLVVFYVEWWSSIPWDVSWPIVVRQGTWCVEWECGSLGKVPHVWNGIVDSLERCPEYGLVDACELTRSGSAGYPVCGMGMWMTWKGTSCMEWDSG
jgi:hypothetical protein